MEIYDQLLNAANLLSVEDRLRLIGDIWDAIPEKEMPGPSQEWMEEVHRRYEAYERGEETASPWREVLERVTKRVQGNG